MDGESQGASVARGASHAQGFSEAWETVYKDLPGSFHSKEHELYFKGELIRNLPVGCAIARLGETTTFLNVPAPRKSNRKPGDASPTALAALIAKTPGAQPLEQIIQRHKARALERQQGAARPTPSEEDLTKPEPMSIIDDPYGAASDVSQRIRSKDIIQHMLAISKTIRNAKQKEDLKAQPKPPKGSKLTLVRKDGEPVPPDNQ
jgi:hypothetical protein